MAQDKHYTTTVPCPICLAPTTEHSDVHVTLSGARVTDRTRDTCPNGHTADEQFKVVPDYTGDTP